MVATLRKAFDLSQRAVYVRAQMWGQLTVSPAYMTEEVGPIPECLNCGFDERAAANLCIESYRVHHILIG